MNNKELLEAKRKAKKIFDEIDKIGINTEVIENFNKLTCDKLEELADLEDNIGLPHEKFLGKVWDTLRYAHCYVTMNYAISQEVTKINESNNKIYEAFKELSNILDADTKKAIYENRRKIYDDTPKEEDLEALKKKVLKEMHTDNKTPFEMKGTTDEQQKKDNKPSTKKHLKEGYTRHTFAIKDEQLELIRAIAEYKGIEQKQLLETLLNKAFESIDETTKEKALNYLHNEDEKDLDIFR